MIYSVVLVSGVQQSESVIHIHVSTLFFRFFSHIGHYRVLRRVSCVIQQVLISYLFFSVIGFYKILNIVPCAIQYDLVVYFIYNSVMLGLP